ncbi:amidohydrolase [Rasiella rasia]|uniref:Amidohydrolase n=1 Tax=Rasiella rasia TaxID=2744027 RepID=A0A6G6GKM2_9FLAO|nr:amidohydrolase [Rasiella rasia]QIE59067.1 amidohydrolase [Rasiella rasia]
MKSILFFLTALLILTSCAPEKISADLLVKNATIYTVNQNFDTANAFVIHDGKIAEVGKKPELELKYAIAETYDAKGATIVPGLIDAHAHLYNLGVTRQQVDLVGTTSFEEVLERVKDFQNEKNLTVIKGRGWDQNDWEVKEFPTNVALDSLFPDIPVVLTRIDGHAMIANSKALELAGITNITMVKGGEVVLDSENKLTGILIDTPMGMVYRALPAPTQTFSVAALKEAEKICLELGLTTVNDAGLSRDVIELIDSLQQAEALKIKVYAMVSNSEKNLDYFLKKGVIKTDRLTVRSVKVYADGALGSRGAAMRKEYSDKPGHFGAMITPAEDLELLANRLARAGYQMNTHAIGDSANISVLRAYKKALENYPDARWKVEHAQVVSMTDFDIFSKNIIPSIQPTHATSDMYWAEDRVGEKRIKGAYAYKRLLDIAGIVVLGTDFPVERVNPMHTFYAAVARKDLKNYPEGGFRMEDALSREETLKGMTTWAAYSNFEEAEKGSIEKGKAADFTVLDRDIMTVPVDSIPNTKVLATFINGKKVYARKDKE